VKISHTSLRVKVKRVGRADLDCRRSGSVRHRSRLILQRGRYGPSGHRRSFPVDPWTSLCSRLSRVVRRRNLLMPRHFCAVSLSGN